MERWEGPGARQVKSALAWLVRGLAQAVGAIPAGLLPAVRTPLVLRVEVDSPRPLC